MREQLRVRSDLHRVMRDGTTITSWYDIRGACKSFRHCVTVV
jgi:hypothetical protein